MVNNVTTYNTIYSSNYTNAKTIQKTDFTNNPITDNTKNKETSEKLTSDTFIKSNPTNNELTYKPLNRKLSADEIKVLKEDQENTKANLAKVFIGDTINGENKSLKQSSSSNNNNESLKNSTELLAKIFGSTENSYSPISTSDNVTKTSTSDRGVHSINDVSDSIINMGTSLAGNNKDTLKKMKDAFDKGYSKAESIFKNATNNDLPQICKDTYKEVMNRFDKLLSTNSNTDINNITSN